MEQTPKIHLAKSPLEVLAAPKCDACGATARFVGLETDPHNSEADLCTYQCIVCQRMQAVSVVRTNGHAVAPQPAVPVGTPASAPEISTSG